MLKEEIYWYECPSKTILNKNKSAPLEKPCNYMDHNEKIISSRNASFI